MDFWTGGGAYEPMSSSYDGIYIGGAVLAIGIVTGAQKLINGIFDLRSKITSKENPLFPARTINSSSKKKVNEYKKSQNSISCS